MLPGDRAMQEALEAQDGLYTVVERHADGTQDVRVVGSIVEYRFAPDDPEAVVERMAGATTHVVSLTITEGGYVADPEHPDVAHDLSPAARPGRCSGCSPRRCAAAATAASRRSPSCRATTSRATARSPGTGSPGSPGGATQNSGGGSREVACPASMVDRITPATSDEDRAELAERHGIDDRWPVVCEPFLQWVVEDAFSAGR